MKQGRRDPFIYVTYTSLLTYIFKRFVDKGFELSGLLGWYSFYNQKKYRLYKTYIFVFIYRKVLYVLLDRHKKLNY